jgi:transcription termination/antitermination protein NusG
VEDQVLQPEENKQAQDSQATPTDLPDEQSLDEVSGAAESETSAIAIPALLDEESDEQPAPPAGPQRHWYVVHCYSGYENKVKKGLEQRVKTMPPEQKMEELIFRVIVPTEEEIDLREGKRKVIPRRVFPGYILVEMIITEESWYVVRNTPGVTGFVSSGDKPTPLREDEVAKILKRMETDQPKVRVTYRPGQVVHIIEGPFADFRGTVDEVNMEKGKVRVMVSFFGRETPVELDLLQVEKV